MKDAMRELQISYGSFQYNRPLMSLPYSSATSDSLVFPLGSRSLQSIVSWKIFTVYLQDIVQDTC